MRVLFRSRLLGDFRFEQSDPARFYGALGDDTATMVADLWRAATDSPASGRTVLDVGGGPGYFSQAFADNGFDYLGVQPAPAEPRRPSSQDRVCQPDAAPGDAAPLPT